MAGLPAASQASRDWPPFQARVVKPRISTLTPQRSSVRARISAQVAATVIGRPRIEPELSSRSVTTVSRKLVSFSRLNDKRVQRIDDDAREPRRIEQTLLQVEFPGPVLLRHQPALQPVGEPRHDALQMRELLVEIAAQPVELLRLAQLLGRHHLVMPGDEGPIVGAARLVDAVPPRAPRLGRSLGIAHLGIVGHLGGQRFRGLGRGVGHVLARRIGLVEPRLHVLGFGALAVLAGLLLAAVLVALLAFLLVRLVAAVLAHVEGVEQIVDGVAEARLMLHQPFEPVEIAPGAVLDQRPPQLDQLLAAGGGD